MTRTEHEPQLTVATPGTVHREADRPSSDPGKATSSDPRRALPDAAPGKRPRIILASASPRRRELLREHGFDAEIVPPPVSEPQHCPPGLPPAAFAEALSYFKAASVARSVKSGVVVAGDTVVALEDTIFGKPADRDDARRILKSLAGTTHKVITGITVLDAGTHRCAIAHDTTTVVMRSLSDGQIEGYLDSGEWQGKAGAYGIQDCGDAFVERIEGSFTNVVGLPIELLTRMLELWYQSTGPARPCGH